MSFNLERSSAMPSALPAHVPEPDQPSGRPLAQAPLPDLPEAGPDELRRVFRRHAAAVAVVTVSQQGTPVGLLVTSLASVSASPPLISFNVARASSGWAAIEVADHVGVHVLGSDQEELARRFARPGADRFAAPTAWQSGPHDVPVLGGTAAWAVAVVDQRIPAGDHVIVVARLLHADTQDDSGPLVHHDGEYRPVTPSTRPGSPPVSRLTVIRTGGIGV
jgi:flavin reductase (DIM6/NTAB) family NADH-FMN oxidoreductase RutF